MKIKAVVGISSKPCLNSFFKNIHKKLLWMNFIAILCDGTTDTSITEQEVVSGFFVDPDTIEPTLTFFECLG